MQVFALFQDGAPPRYSLLGATVHHIGRPHTGVRAMARLVREHRRAPFDVLHGIWGSPAGLLAAAAGRVLRRPSLIHLFGGELVSLPDVPYGEMRTRKGRQRMRFAMGAATRLTAQSGWQVKAATELGYSVERVPMGVDAGEWPPVPPRVRDPHRPARFIHVASISPVKDQATLIRAMARLNEQGRDFRLDVVGEDTMGGAVQRLAEPLGDRVRFHGVLTQAEIRPLMLEADVLIMTSRSEAGPIVLAEAAMCGVPTVGTAVGQIAEWAPDAAVAVAVANPDALAAAITGLLDDEPRRIRISTLAQARARAEDADRTAARINRLYREMTQR